MPEPDKVTSDSVGEVVDYLKEYVTQETIEPLRGWGRYVGFGVLGSVMAAIGVSIALLGLLRLLQTEVDAFDGPNSSIFAYLITLGAGIIVIGFVVWQIMRHRTLQRGAVVTEKKITRDDIERELRGLQTKLVTGVESQRSNITTAIAIGVVIFAAVFFLLGKRSGKRKSTVVEIRRI